MRVTPVLCDEPRGLFAAIFSSAFKHPGLRDQLFGDQGFESPSLQCGVRLTNGSGTLEAKRAAFAAVYGWTGT